MDNNFNNNKAKNNSKIKKKNFKKIHIQIFLRSLILLNIIIIYSNLIQKNKRNHQKQIMRLLINVLVNNVQ
jgi:hypothetical protein